MADMQLVLSDVLCFLVNKYGKVSSKMLKNVLSDYYSAEVVSDAKFQLSSDIDMLNLSTQRPHMPQRRDVDGRITKEVDDILSLFNFTDENKLTDKLPKYVASSPDCMPSLRLYDGDMNTVMNILRNLEMKVVDLGLALAAMNREIHSLQQVSYKQSQPAHLFDCNHVVKPTNTASVNNNNNKTRATSRPEAGSSSRPEPAHEFPVPAVCMGNTSETVTSHIVSDAAVTAVSDWATLSSTPCHNRFATLPRDDSGDGDTDADDRPYAVVARRNSKRIRRGSTPQQHQQQQQPPSKPPRSTRSTAVIGKAVNINIAAIKAAKKIRKRAVFCVDNVNTACSVKDLCSFVGKLSVNVISCFEVKPRQQRNDWNQCERKAFRLCIFDEDRERLLNAAVWPDSIKISPWYFKSATDAGNRNVNVAAAAGADVDASVDGAPLVANSATNVAAAVAVTATVECAPSVDAADVLYDDNSVGNNTMCMSDDTILAADNHSDGV